MTTDAEEHFLFLDVERRGVIFRRALVRSKLGERKAIELPRQCRHATGAAPRQAGIHTSRPGRSATSTTSRCSPTRTRAEIQFSRSNLRSRKQKKSQSANPPQTPRALRPRRARHDSRKTGGMRRSIGASAWVSPRGRASGTKKPPADLNPATASIRMSDHQKVAVIMAG